jgi:hypothetical protein
MEIAIILIAVLGVGFVGLLVKRTMLAGARAIALSKYTEQFALYDAVMLHDWAVCHLVNMHTHPWGRANFTDAQYYDFHLEAIVALRDRVDALSGKAHGPGNKVAIRTKTALATSSLNKNTPYFDRSEIKAALIIHSFPTEGINWLGDHLETMRRIYVDLDQASPVPGLESRFRA